MKETKEALIAANEVSIEVITRLRDGFQAGEDLGAIFGRWQSDEDFKNKIAAGIKDASKIPEEFQAVTAEGVVELVSVQVSYIPKIINAMKKPA